VLMTKILYICHPASIHDFKWMSFFSMQTDKYQVFATYENPGSVDKATVSQIKASNITLLDSLYTFSFRKPFKILQSILRLRKFIKENEIDLVHILMATPHSIWGNFIKVPHIITTRGTDVLITIPSMLKIRGFKRLYIGIINKLLRRSFLKAYRITSTSEAQANAINQIYHISDVSVIRTGVEVKKISSITKTIKVEEHLGNKKFIFSPRHLNNPIYNTKMQIDAIPLLKKDLLNEYTFVFINKNNMFPEHLKNLTLQLQELKETIDFNFIIINRLSQEVLWQFYKKASLTIMTPMTDGTPNTALEAMAAKCPLIIPNLDYDKRIFSNSCLKLAENTPECLAETITNAISFYDQSFINNGFNNVKQFGNRETEMRKLEAIYSTIKTVI
ncbi:MAG: glycosyltransferase, partial [bacterium]